MKRSLQEYVELIVFGLVALLVGTGLLWLVGWVLSGGGFALRWLAGLLWTLLRFIVPIAIAGGLVYFIVKAVQERKPAEAGGPSREPRPVQTVPTHDSGTSPPAAGTAPVERAPTQPMAGVQAEAPQPPRPAPDPVHPPAGRSAVAEEAAEDRGTGLGDEDRGVDAGDDLTRAEGDGPNSDGDPDVGDDLERS